MDEKPYLQSIRALEIALKIAAEVHCDWLDPTNFDGEIASQMRKHGLSKEWSDRVTSVTMGLHSFAVAITEQSTKHFVKKRLKAQRSKSDKL